MEQLYGSQEVVAALRRRLPPAPCVVWTQATPKAWHSRPSERGVDQLGLNNPSPGSISGILVKLTACSKPAHLSFYVSFCISCSQVGQAARND